MPKPEVATIDFETAGIEGRPNYPPKPAGVAIKLPGQPSKYYAWGHPAENNCSLEDAKRAVGRTLTDYPVLCHNVRFDADVAEVHLGLQWPWHKTHDTQILAYLVDPHARQIGLKPLAERFLGLPPEEQEAVRDWLFENGVERRGCKQWGRSICQAPGNLVGTYAIGDTDRTAALFDVLYAEVEKAGMLPAYRRELSLLPILLENERQGVQVDVDLLAKDIQEIRIALAEVDACLLKKLDCDINLDSDAELTAAIDRYQPGIEWPLTEKGARSATKDTFAEVLEDKELLAMLQYRASMQTCVGTFMEPWLAVASRTGGRIHTAWQSTKGEGGGTRTGRLSSSPNFQNIPTLASPRFAKVIELHAQYLAGYGWPTLPAVRGYIVADSQEHVLCDRDFSQQELRVLAHFESDLMMDAYHRDPKLDLHQFAADMIQEKVGISLTRKATKTCIAKGSLVLTQLGLVPIEDITSLHLVWDGVEWVKHTGVISQGMQEVVTYQGLTGTADHEVWTREFGKIQLGVASRSGAALVKTEQNGQPVRYLESAERYGLEKARGEGRPTQTLLGSTVPKMFGITMGSLGKYTARALYTVPKLLNNQAQAFKGVGAKIRCDLAALQQAALSRLSLVWGPGDRVQIPESYGIHEFYNYCIPNGILQRAPCRQDRQQWALRNRELALSTQFNKRQEQDQQPICKLQGAGGQYVAPLALAKDRLPRNGTGPRPYCKEACNGAIMGGNSGHASQSIRRAEVFDITNAGPRNRFTVSGALVSNCAFGLLYGMGQAELAVRLGVSVEAASSVKRAYLSTFSGIADIQAELKARARNDLPMTTWGGRRYFVEPSKVVQGRLRSFDYKLFNFLIQGSSADVTKEAMIRYHQAKKESRLLLTVHDQILICAPKGCWEQEMAILREAMDGIELDVPLVSDGDVGYRWGQLEECV